MLCGLAVWLFVVGWFSLLCGLSWSDKCDRFWWLAWPIVGRFGHRAGVRTVLPVVLSLPAVVAHPRPGVADVAGLVHVGTIV